MQFITEEQAKQEQQQQEKIAKKMIKESPTNDRRNKNGQIKADAEAAIT